MAVFSDMQVKQETNISDSLTANKSHQRLSSSITPSTTVSSGLSPQDMQCLGSAGTTTQPQDKNSSPYSLWADYFDSFSVQTEFDLRSGNNVGSGSTGSSIASSSTSSASSERWSSPGSGSPFSDCDHEDSAFIDDHSVPNSVIDEIVQTLKMDGYNFDHLGDNIMDTNTEPYYPIKQEQEFVTQQTCYIANPVYASLSPPKLHLHIDNTNNRKSYYNNANTVHNTINNNNSNSNMLHNTCISDNSMNGISIFDQVIDGKWCNSTTTLPPMSISLQQIQQHTAQLQHQQTPVQNTQHQQHLQIHPQHIQDPQQVSYATSNIQDSTMHIQYSSTPMFPGNYTALPTNNNNIQNVTEQYKYLPNLPADMQQPPPLTQSCEKPTETKPRRRRSSNGPLKQEKPHVCNECGAAFKLSANLKQHQVIHTGEKPFSCDICKAMFTRLSSLKTHHRLHTGEKPHICPYCSAAFADRSAMKAHKRIHTGERPYKCVVCGTSFTQLSHLNAHKRTHTGEKPYACGICGTTFKQLGHLKRHEKSHVCSRI